jgi:two-component system response regulator AtoC
MNENIHRIAVVDDEPMILSFMQECIRRRGYDVVTGNGGGDAVGLLSQDDVQMAFIDMKMEPMDGMEVLRCRREQLLHVPCVMMTAYGDPERASKAMQMGAFDFLVKPFSSDQVAIAIEKVRLALSHGADEEGAPRGLSDSSSGNRLAGGCEEFLQVMRMAERVAPTQATVLITGESGTGKELVATEICQMSDPEGQRPYVRMNCAAIPEPLLESELFGHEKGSFTGAVAKRIGRFELANGGTLLLDEIGEISPAMQTKLLRVLQEGEFERVGGSESVQVEVRVIATTNRDLKKEVREGRFRQDLFYRLNVFPIHLPPLRKRGNDIVVLADELLKRQQSKLDRPLHFSPASRQALQIYPWPGNVRELENVIERMAILADRPTIEPADFPPEIRTPTDVPGSLDAAQTFNLRELEHRTILKALQETGGNRTEAARLLGFSVRTLRNKLHGEEIATAVRELGLAV